jgi:uncharacterized protein
MDRYNIVMGFLSHFNTEEAPGMGQKRHPDRFILSPFIHEPGEIDPEEIRKELEAKSPGRYW